MRRAYWLALDLIKEGPSPGRAIAVLIYPCLLLPLQSGLIDGALAAGGTLPAWLGARHSVTLGALPCGIAALGITLEVFFPRRIRGDLEPILATPITERELIAACALPGWLLACAAPAVAQPLAQAGFALTAGRLPGHALADASWIGAAGLVSMVWITAALSCAAFRARSLGAAMAWAMAGFLPVAATDVACAGAACAAPRLAWAALAASLAAALAALWLCARKVRREDLLAAV